MLFNAVYLLVLRMLMATLGTAQDNCKEYLSRHDVIYVWELCGLLIQPPSQQQETATRIQKEKDDSIERILLHCILDMCTSLAVPVSPIPC